MKRIVPRVLVPAVVVVAVVVGIVAVAWDDDDARAGRRSTELAEPIGLDDNAVVVDDRLVVVGDHDVVAHDTSSLDVVAHVEGTRPRPRFGPDGWTLVVDRGTITGLGPDGAERWHVDDVVPVAMVGDGTTVVAACAVASCHLSALGPDGALLWERDLDGGPRPVAFAEGELLTHPGHRAVLSVPTEAVVTVGDAGDRRQVLRLDPATGEPTVLATGAEFYDVDVVDGVIAVVTHADPARCVLRLLRPDGTEIAAATDDCADVAQVETPATLFGQDGHVVWISGTDIRTFAVDGTEVDPVPVGDPPGVPTRAGVLRTTDGDGWSLQRPDGSEVLTQDWEWFYDAGTDAVAVGRALDVGPFWSRSSVVEVALVDVDDGSVCASQRVPADSEVVVRILGGCHAVVTATPDGETATSWHLGA